MFTSLFKHLKRKISKRRNRNTREPSKDSISTALKQPSTEADNPIPTSHQHADKAPTSSQPSKVKEKQRVPARPSLPPEVQWRILDIMWNSPDILDPNQRAIFTRDVVRTLPEDWKTNFLKCAFRDIHLPSIRLQWFYAEPDALLDHFDNHRLGLSKKDCRAIHLLYPDISDETYLLYHERRSNDSPFRWVRWSYFTAADFPNLKTISIDDIDIRTLDACISWQWIEHFPTQVDTLVLSFTQDPKPMIGVHGMKLVYDTLGIKTVKKLYLNGISDGEWAWRVFINMFPELSCVFCDGQEVRRPEHLIRVHEYLSHSFQGN